MVTVGRVRMTGEPDRWRREEVGEGHPRRIRSALVSAGELAGNGKMNAFQDGFRREQLLRHAPENGGEAQVPLPLGP